ncbi:hypothetical protein [Sphingobacterium multivorum]|uniref:hypothetical protein n=1 Tax=Sphingobacterium multivorum TaxID=28454 RepID=UPI003DA30C2F
MSVKERLKIFIKQENLNISDFERSIKASNGYVNSISKSIGLDKLNTLIENYPKINLEWLITGKGEMIKNENFEKKISNEDASYWKGRYDEVSERNKELQAEIALLKGESEIKSNNVGSKTA